MITRARTTFGRSYTGFARMAAAGIALLLAGCIEESPIAFSPDGKTLAFVTAEPYRTQDGGFVVGPQAFRLMLLDEQRQIRVLETATDTMLSGPAFSPDGKRLAYLRVPLPTWQRSQQIKEDFEQRSKTLKNLANPTWMTWVVGQQESGATEPAPQIQDQVLPPLKSTYITSALMMVWQNTTATLVVRDLAGSQIVSTIPVELLDAGSESMYVNARLQFAPSGQQIYFAAGNLLMAVDLASGQKRILAAGGSVPRLSPDGQMLATTIDDTIGLVATDGDLAIYRRLPASPVNGAAWIDSKTVAVLQDKPKAAQAPSQPAAAAATASTRNSLVIYRIHRDGKLLEPVEIALPADAPAGVTLNQLAVAPDGKHVVVSMASAAAFGSLGGREFQYLKNADLQQPTFSPDSRRIAFKVMQTEEGKPTRTAAIAFFSTEGKELFRVPIPPIEPGATRPASQPAPGK